MTAPTPTAPTARLLEDKVVIVTGGNSGCGEACGQRRGRGWYRYARGPRHDAIIADIAAPAERRVLRGDFSSVADLHRLVDVAVRTACSTSWSTTPVSSSRTLANLTEEKSTSHVPTSRALVRTKLAAEQ